MRFRRNSRIIDDRTRLDLASTIFKGSGCMGGRTAAHVCQRDADNAGDVLQVMDNDRSPDGPEACAGVKPNRCTALL
jgi:hypothetical protein